MVLISTAIVLLLDKDNAFPGLRVPYQRSWLRLMRIGEEAFVVLRLFRCERRGDVGVLFPGVSFTGCSLDICRSLSR